MKKLRILYVTHSVPMQGANLALLELMLGLREKGLIEPVVLMPKVEKAYNDHNLYNVCLRHGIECHCHQFYPFHNTKRYPSYLRCMFNLVSYPYILFKLRKLHIDIVHSNGSVLSLGGYLSRIKKVPHVWHFREAGALHYGTVSLPGKRYEKWVYTLGDAFIAISKALMNYCTTLVDEDKLHLVYDGVACEEKTIVSHHDSDVLQLCMVGLVNPPKNQLDALKAMNIIVNEWGINQVRLTFIGYEESVYSKKLHSFVTENGLEQHVVFLGERTDVAELLEGMDIGLMLSKFEAFGRVTVEYMQHGLAVIATETGANPEIVEDGTTGLIIPLGDYRQLAVHIRTLMNDKKKLLNFSERGRERAMKLFSSERNAMQVYDIYQSLLMKTS